ncbi:unnamed protein product [Closterium sp. NIES-53]
MEVARTSMIQAVAPHFLWLFAVRYAAHQLNLWPRVSLPETSPTLRWTRKVGNASVFRVWGSRAFVRDTSADKLSARAIPCVFLGFPPDAPGWQFYHPTLRHVLPSQDVMFDESVPFYRLFPYLSSPLPPVPLFLAQESGTSRGPASRGATSGGAEPSGVEYGGAEPAGAEPGGAEHEGAEPGGAVSGGVEPRGAGATSLGGAGDAGLGGSRTRGTGAARAGGAAGAGAEATGARCARAGGTGDSGPEGTRAAGVGGAGGVGAGGTGVGAARSTRAAGAGSGHTGRPRPYFVPLLQQVLGLPSSTGLTPPLLCLPPDQSKPPIQLASPLPAPSPYTEQTGGLTERREPVSHPASPVRAVCTSHRVPPLRPPTLLGTHHMALLHAASPTVPRLLATVVTDPLFESAAASALVAELVDFAVACRLDYAACLVAESESDCPPSIGGECALGTNVLEDMQEDFECFATAIAMDEQMASWKSTCTYVDAVPPPGANIVDVMWIFGGVDFFHTFSPTLKMTTLRVLLHIAAQCDYELQSLDFNTPSLQGSLHEEIWLRCPPSFTRSFPARSQWSLRRPVYSLRQAPREWNDTLRTTLAALGFAPSADDPSLFLRTDTLLPPFYILMYVDDLVLPLLTLRHWPLLAFQFSSPRSTPLPTELLGCLMYLMTCTRHDLASPLSILARYVAPERHRPEQWEAAKRVLRYLCSTSGTGLVLGGRGPIVVTGNADASWVDKSATQRSSQGYTCSLRSGSLSWQSTRSSSVLSSNCEAEIYARAMASQELRWLIYLLTELGEHPRSSPVLTKHIALRYFLARELQQRGQLCLAYVATKANTADIFTKALKFGDHQPCFAFLDWSCDHLFSPTLPMGRANRTITETAHVLLIEAGLPDYFWPDAVRGACVAKNRALTHVGADKWVPYVEWIGRKPKVDMLRVFGCMCMALVPKHLRHNKLGAKAIWAVHLGMAQNSKGWLLWDPFTKKFLVSRDCKFMENLIYKDWKAENEAKIGVRLGDVKSSGLEHVELPLELSSGSTTTRQSDTSFSHYECSTDPSHPAATPRPSSTLKEALESSDAEEWKKAMESELKSIEENGTWELVELPEGQKAITSKWLFKIKSDANGKIERYKSRLVAKGYQQKEKGLFAPVVKPTTLRTLLAGTAIKGWVVKQMDVTTAFLNGVLEEEIFMAQPEGFDDGSGKVLRLKKALYGLKQAPRQWYLKLRGVLEGIGFTPSSADHSLFMLGEGEQRSFMVVYVDDILIFSPSSDLVKEVMLKLQDKFKCEALGDVSFYLGLHIERDMEKRCMRVHQRKYLEVLAANFGQSEGHVATPFPSRFKCVKGPEEESAGEEERRRFHSLVGSLMYAAVNTRPDVAFATGQLARVVQCPNEEQVVTEMRVAKYLGQTPTVGLQYSAAAQRRKKGADGVEPGRLFLTAFSDASFASEPEDMTSVGGFICCVGGGPTAWESKKQVDQALSSVESEYMALFRAVREIVWQRRLLA